MSFEAMNSNNHQTTWGVMGEAVGALLDWIDGGVGGQAEGGSGGVAGPGAAFFGIWDGGREVGVGQVG